VAVVDGQITEGWKRF